MSYTVEVQPDQSVILVTYKDTVDARQLAVAQQTVVESSQKHELKRVFCIQDIRDAKIDFVDGIVHSKQMIFEGRKIAGVDIEILVIFVGMNRAAKFFMQLRQMTPARKFRTAAVDTMDDALALIKRETAPQ
jgi:hypothetical protein